jgi:hypothetical protein
MERATWMDESPAVAADAALPVAPSRRTRQGAALLGAAVGLGVLGDLLLRTGPWGLNLTLWAAALVLAGVLLRDRWDAEGSVATWVPAALAIAALFAWRDSPTLKALDVVALVLVLSMGMAHARGVSLRSLGIARHLESLLDSVADVVAGAPTVVFGDVRWGELSGSGRSRTVMAAVRGVAIAVPLLLVFGALLASADAAFERLLSGVVRFDAGTAVTHVLLAGFFAWLAAGVLRTLVLGRESVAKPIAARPVPLALGVVETAVAMGLLNALFLAFVAAQLPYFFGGDALVRAADAPSYAEYARRGFFELVTVAGLSLGVLLSADWLLRGAAPAQVRVFRVLAAVQVGLVAVMMASALHRMRLYQLAYGLTETRLYTTAFMLWLAVVFAWFAATVLRGRRPAFAFGALVAAVDVLVLLHVVNPDALIVRSNAARPDAAASFDAAYASVLSADGVPALVRAMAALPAERRCVAAGRVLDRWDARDGDWRTWSLARQRAVSAVARHRAELEEMRCASDGGGGS